MLFLCLLAYGAIQAYRYLSSDWLNDWIFGVYTSLDLEVFVLTTACSPSASLLDLTDLSPTTSSCRQADTL